MKTRTQYRIVSTITKEALQTEISGTFVDAHFCSVCSFLQKHRQNLQKRGYVCGNAQQKKLDGMQLNQITILHSAERVRIHQRALLLSGQM